MDTEEARQLALAIVADVQKKEVAKTKRCKDCEPGVNRPAPFPGPRCTTHNREFKKKQKAANHGKYVERQYGIDSGTWKKLLAFQDGKCPICQRANGATRRLSTDHDHSCCNGSTSCGECVRGLLCRPCNDMLGHGRDTIEFFERAIEYLNNPPYKRMREQQWETNG